MTEDGSDARVYQFTPAPPPAPYTPLPPPPQRSRPRRRGNSRRSRATKAAAGLALVLGAGAGSAAAVMAKTSGHPSGFASATSGFASATVTTPTTTPAPRVPWGFRGPSFYGPLGQLGAGARTGLGGLIHGSFTVRGPSGSYETLDTQVGTVEDVSSSSLTVKSADGFSQSYSVTASTVVYAGDRGIGSVAKGDQVAVVGLATGGGVTAERVVDLTQLQANRRSWAPPRAPSAPAARGPNAANVDSRAFGAFGQPPSGAPGPGWPAA